ncbi:MAG: hypothetical protein ACTSXK_14140 [Promethearchaeota archaeon]
MSLIIMPNRDGTGPRGKGPRTGKRGGHNPPRDGNGKKKRVK